MQTLNASVEQKISQFYGDFQAILVSSAYVFLFEGGGGPKIQNFPNFKFFPNQVRGGGVVKLQNFPKFKKVQIILGEGGGGRKLWTFSTFCGIFFSTAPISTYAKYHDIVITPKYGLFPVCLCACVYLIFIATHISDVSSRN